MTALSVFLIIAAVGFGFLLVSLLFGEIFELLGFDLHTGDFGAGEGAHGFIDSRVVSVFITAFGGFGAIGVMSGMNTLVSSMLGIAGGVILALVVSLFGKFLLGQQSSSSVTSGQLVGRTAQVVVAIPAGGVGQVSCRIGEERLEKLARTADGLELKHGALVRIDDIAGDSIIVSPYTPSSSSDLTFRAPN